MNELPPTVEISPPHRATPLWRCSWGEMFGLAIVASVILVCWRVHAISGILSLLIVVPAYVRTQFWVSKQKSLGVVPSSIYRWMEFFYSCLVVATAICAYVFFVGSSLLGIFAILSMTSLLPLVPVWLGITLVVLVCVMSLIFPYVVLGGFFGRGIDVIG
jgi:hypothetical protein